MNPQDLPGGRHGPHAKGDLRPAPRPGPPRGAPGSRVPPWHEQDVEALLAGMAEGSIDPVDLTLHFLHRIETLDPSLGAVLETNPRAVDEARRAATQWAALRSRGELADAPPLLGIPVLLKDNIDTAFPLHCSAGSLALGTTSPARDAPLVVQLREAGAVILGKTNLSEWANFRGQHSVSGWSSLGGQTRNPHDPTRSPCGSSSGSAVAVAAGLAPLAVGTETDGSIVCPAQICGVVGFKPTHGHVPGEGIIPLAPSQDCAGPMARNAADAALLYRVLRRPGLVDPPPSPWRSGADPARPLAGCRLGVPRELFALRTDLGPTFAAALDRLRSLGAEVEDVAGLPKSEAYQEWELVVLVHEFRHHLDAYLAQRQASTGQGPGAMAQVVAFNTAHADQILALFGQEWMQAGLDLGTGPVLELPAYLEAIHRGPALCRAALDAVVGPEAPFHALVMPSGSPAWIIEKGRGDNLEDHVESTSLPAVAGYPHLTVPLARLGGLPVGLSFIGGRDHDLDILTLGDLWERGWEPEAVATADHNNGS